MVTDDSPNTSDWESGGSGLPSVITMEKANVGSFYSESPVSFQLRPTVIREKQFYQSRLGIVVEL